MLRAPEEPLVLGLGTAAGYATPATADGSAETVHWTLGARAIAWRWLEAALDVRADFDIAPRPGSGTVRSWGAHLWAIGHLDLMPLVPFVGLGAGATLSAAWDAATPTAGVCGGLALWIASRWRMTLRAAQRWEFDAAGTLVTEVAFAGEWFFPVWGGPSAAADGDPG